MNDFRTSLRTSTRDFSSTDTDDLADTGDAGLLFCPIQVPSQQRRAVICVSLLVAFGIACVNVIAFHTLRAVDAGQGLTGALLQFNAILLLLGAMQIGVVWMLLRSVLCPLSELTRMIGQHDLGAIENMAHRPRLCLELRRLAMAFMLLLVRLGKREEALREGMQHFQLLAENSNDLICGLDRSGRFTYVSPVSHALLGRSPEEVMQRSLFELVHTKDEPDVRRALGWSALRQGSLCYRLRRRDDTYVWVESSFRVIAKDGGNAIACVTRDITERRRNEESLRRMARHDALTGLPNRLHLKERIEETILQATQTGTLFALVMFDLDRFKFVNDTIGHGAGDELLRAATARLRKVVRHTDLLARWGGDEFVLLIGNLSHRDEALLVTRKCLATLSEPVNIQGMSLHVGASAGIAVFPDAGYTETELMRSADMAMYRAKETGGSCAMLYTADLSERTRLRMSTENDLHEALENHLFELRYQPIMNAASGRIQAAEALLRWRRGTEYVSPDVFIPVAEDTGLIVPIGLWVLQEACATARRLIDIGLAAPDFVMSVNVSARQFRDRAFVTLVRRTLDEARLPATQLQLELTESAIMADPGMAESAMRAIRELGVRIAIDDFGTGYSSLAYLARFPATALKIDRSFVNRLADHGPDTTIVKATIAIAHELGMSVTAEGVETGAQRDALVDLGCEHLQGYLFDRPLHIKDLEQRLRPVLEGAAS